MPQKVLCYRAHVDAAYDKAVFPMLFQEAGAEKKESFVQRVRMIYDALNEAYNGMGIYQLRIDEVYMETHRVDTAFEVG